MGFSVKKNIRENVLKIESYFSCTNNRWIDIRFVVCKIHDLFFPAWNGFNCTNIHLYHLNNENIHFKESDSITRCLHTKVMNNWIGQR